MLRNICALFLLTTLAALTAPSTHAAPRKGHTVVLGASRRVQYSKAGDPSGAQPGETELRIRALIVSGRIPRSARMTENQLARQLGVSRTPVREALQTLETEGFLDAVPRSGYEVKMLLPEEMEGICEIRKVLECLAARWAIEHITADELQHLADKQARFCVYNSLLSEAAVLGFD